MESRNVLPSQRLASQWWARPQIASIRIFWARRCQNSTSNFKYCTKHYEFDSCCVPQLDRTSETHRPCQPETRRDCLIIIKQFSKIFFFPKRLQLFWLEYLIQCCVNQTQGRECSSNDSTQTGQIIIPFSALLFNHDTHGT